MLLALVLAGCGSEAPTSTNRGETARVAPSPTEEAEAAVVAHAEELAERERLDEAFPHHGLVTGVQLRVRLGPDREAQTIGWLRIGSRLRVAESSTRSPRCSSGWYAVSPRGFVCSGQGLDVGDEPPAAAVDVPPPDRDATLPYTYLFVKEVMVPQFHRLPARSEQRAADEYARRYLELLEQNERRAARFLAGELANEPTRPAVVARYLDRGFFLASTGIVRREDRDFARTVSGAYVQRRRLEERTGAEYGGLELDDENTLPVAFMLRESRPMMPRTRSDGTAGWRRDPELESLPRRARVETWAGRQLVGDDLMHIVGPERFLPAHHVGVAELLEPPFRVQRGEPWVHVDISEQTLVLYEGPRPVFVTLVSSGLDGHDTPVGVFSIQKKLIADTMANLGPEAGDDRYRIEDVPWTQYFDGSFALHAAFWHNGFGLRRSHGCVNLSPRDAHRVFSATWPEIPAGWHGVVARDTDVPVSRVVVTE